MINAKDIALALSPFRFDCTSELTLQNGIALALDVWSARVAGGVLIEREIALTERDRPDFVVWDATPAVAVGDAGIAIEVKIGGSTSALLRQVWRYAESPRVREILVVSSIRQHSQLADTARGKPVRVLSVSRAFG